MKFQLVSCLKDFRAIVTVQAGENALIQMRKMLQLILVLKVDICICRTIELGDTQAVSVALIKMEVWDGDRWLFGVGELMMAFG